MKHCRGPAGTSDPFSTKNNSHANPTRHYQALNHPVSFAARSLRAAVVACGATGAGAARGAATKAVKRAPLRPLFGGTQMLRLCRKCDTQKI